MVLWDCTHKPGWLPEPDDLGVSPGWQLQKLGFWKNISAISWEVSVSCAERECNNCAPWLMFPTSAFVASRCTPNLKPAPKFKAPWLASSFLFTESLGLCFSCCLSRSLGQGCQELFLWFLNTHGTQERKAPWSPVPGYWGVSLGWQPQKLGHQV